MVKYSMVQVVKYDGTFGSVSCTHEGFFFLIVRLASVMEYR